MVPAVLVAQIIPFMELITKPMLSPTTGSPQVWFVLTTATSEKLFIGFFGTLVRYGPQEMPNAFGFAAQTGVEPNERSRKLRIFQLEAEELLGRVRNRFTDIAE